MQDESDDQSQFLVELHHLRERVSELEKERVERKRAEEALKDSEERYHSLFEKSIDGVFVTSPEGKILDISRAGIVMFGYETKNVRYLISQLSFHRPYGITVIVRVPTVS